MFGEATLKQMSQKEKDKLQKIEKRDMKKLEKATTGDLKSIFFDDHHEKAKKAMLQLHNLKSVFEEVSKPRAERYVCFGT